MLIRLLCRCAVFLLIMILSVSGCSSVQAVDLPDKSSSSPQGWYGFDAEVLETVSETAELNDRARGKKLQIRVTYPLRKGLYPLIIWSHGAGGSRDSYKPLVQFWAERGYVVIQATHADSLSLPGNRGKGLSFLLSLPAWTERPGDISLIIDSIGEIASLVPGVDGKIDRTHIGMGGHSFGAHTTQLLAGTEARNLQGEKTSYADERISFFLMISPQGKGGEFDEDSWTGVTEPFAVITGTEDKGRKGDPYTWRVDPFRYSRSAEKYLFLIDGADHRFGGIAGEKRFFRKETPESEHYLEYVKSISAACWDAYLKHEKQAREFIISDSAGRLSDGTVSQWRDPQNMNLPGEMRTALDLPYIQPETEAHSLQALDIYAPSRDGSLPVLVFVHGGAWEIGDKKQARVDLKSEYFTSKGYVFVSINYRLFPEVTFREQAGDVASALAWVYNHIDKFGGDPRRIFLMGHSAGAHLAALVSVDQKYLKQEKRDLSLIRGTILLDGAGYDIPMQVNLLGTTRNRILYTRVFGKDEKVWEEASPALRIAAGSNLPRFLIFYAGDRVSSEFQSLGLVKKIRAAGGTAEAVHAPGKTHAAINKEIGKPGDPVTVKIMEFLKTAE